MSDLTQAVAEAGAQLDQIDGAPGVPVEEALDDEWTVIEETTDSLTTLDTFGTAFGPDETSREWAVESPGGETVYIRRHDGESEMAQWLVSAEPLSALQS